MSSAGGSDESTSGERIYLRICDYETKEFSGLTTYHGLVRIYNSTTWPSRIFWCVVVLSCLFLFMIHSGFLLLGYHAKPTLFQVNVMVPDEGILFPEITICNYNPVMTTKVQKWNMTSTELSYVLKAYLDDLDEDTEQLRVEDQQFQNYKNRYEAANNKPFDFKEFFINTGPACEDFIVSCSFSGELLEDCCSNSEPILTDFGLCLKFSNVATKRRQWFSGNQYGWQFLLDMKNEERTDLLPDDFADVGVKVHVHEVDSFPSLRSNGISIPPGTALYAGLDVKNVTLLPRNDWGMCQPNWDPAIHGKLMVPFVVGYGIYPSMNQFFKRNLYKTTLPLQYSASHCEYNCVMQRAMNACGCVPLANAMADQVPVCSPLETQECHGKMNDTSPCRCDVKCEQMEYDVQMSYANLIKRNIRTIEEREYTKEYMDENLALIHVYMREISYERHEQQKQMQTADLLSNIAGSMGLFLGMSTVTLLEIFIYLFKSVWGTINSERQKQFEDAMHEEENEEMNREVLILDQPEEMDDEPASPTSVDFPNQGGRKMSRRISIVPFSNNLHSVRRGSAIPTIAISDEQDGEGSQTPLLFPPGALRKKRRSINIVEPSDFLNTQRRSSGPRRSIFHLEGVGDIVPSSSRRGSAFDLNGPNSRRKLSIQPAEDGIHLSIINRRRKSSVTHLKPKHDFLDF